MKWEQQSKKAELVKKFKRFKKYGDDCMRDTPVPIPNTEVKPHNADGTAWATGW